MPWTGVKSGRVQSGPGGLNLTVPASTLCRSFPTCSAEWLTHNFNTLQCWSWHFSRGRGHAAAAAAAALWGRRLLLKATLFVKVVCLLNDVIFIDVLRWSGSTTWPWFKFTPPPARRCLRWRTGRPRRGIWLLWAGPLVSGWDARSEEIDVFPVLQSAAIQSELDATNHGWVGEGGRSQGGMMAPPVAWLLPVYDANLPSGFSSCRPLLSSTFFLCPSLPPPPASPPFFLFFFHATLSPSHLWHQSRCVGGCERLFGAAPPIQM